MTISELQAGEIAEASVLLANSMSTNPNHLAIFKSTGPAIASRNTTISDH